MNAPATSRTRAYVPSTPDPGARLRLFGFHHAGGSAAWFGHWADVLGPEITVLPVQLPGRERRAAEPRFRDAAAQVDELAAALSPLLDRPFAFYGHSMGAILAYRLTRVLAERGGPLPEVLAVGAYPSPELPLPLADAAGMDDEALARKLVSMGGMSEHLLGYPQWRRAATDLVRDDLALCTSPAPGPPLPCPVHAFAGVDDPVMDPEAIAGWRAHTGGGFVAHRVPGGHFFPAEAPVTFLARLAGVLAGVGPALSRD